MKYNILNSQGKTLTFRQFLKNNLNHIYFIVGVNFLMLMVGFLGELNILNKRVSLILGFVFFIINFSFIYYYYVKDFSRNKWIFNTITFLWGLYGIAYLFSSDTKNTSYNILDVFSKNFYGLFICYLIIKKSYLK